MTDPLTPQDVQAALDALGIETRVETLDDSTATAPEAAAAVGVELGAIVKSLCFLIDGEPVIVLAAGDRRVDSRKLAALFDVSRKRVRMADPAATAEITGYEIGGVPPVGHARPLPVLIDESLSRFERVYAAAGSPSSLFPVRYSELVAATRGSVEALAEDS